MKKINLIFITVFLVVFGYFSASSKGEDNSVLSVSFPMNKPASSYDPTNIAFAADYVLLQNLYSTLVTMSPKTGEITSGIARKFWWEGKRLFLEIRTDLKTVKDDLITASDVSFSLKRYIKLSRNQAFKNIICPNGIVGKLKKSCPRITVNKNIVTLDFIDKNASILQMLAGVDFSVVPESSVDQKTLDIVNYRNTTGPYYVSKDGKLGNVVLRANQHHYFYNQNMPQIIKLKPCIIQKGCDPLELFESKQVDMVTGADNINSGKLVEYSKSNKVSIHKTINLQHYLSIFTGKGRLRFSKKDRLIIGKSLKSIFLDLYGQYEDYQEADQIFSAFSDGSLGSRDSKEVHNLMSTINAVRIKRPLTIGLLRIDDEKIVKEALSTLGDKIKVINLSNLPNFRGTKGRNQPDIIIGRPDTGFVEDFGLVTYFMKLGVFGLSVNESNSWLSKYFRIAPKLERMEMLKKLHLNVLNKGQIVPLMNSPFVSLIRSNWSLNFSPFVADNQLWLIRKK